MSVLRSERVAPLLLAVFATLGAFPVVRSLIVSDLNWCYPYMTADSYDWISNALFWSGKPILPSLRPPGLPLVIAGLSKVGLLSLLPVVSFLFLGLSTAFLYLLLRERHDAWIAAAACWFFFANDYVQDLAKYVLAETYATPFLVLAALSSCGRAGTSAGIPPWAARSARRSCFRTPRSLQASLSRSRSSRCGPRTSEGGNSGRGRSRRRSSLSPGSPFAHGSTASIRTRRATTSRRCSSRPFPTWGSMRSRAPLFSAFCSFRSMRWAACDFFSSGIRPLVVIVPRRSHGLGDSPVPRLLLRLGRQALSRLRTAVRHVRARRRARESAEVRDARASLGRGGGGPARRLLSSGIRSGIRATDSSISP